MCDHQRQGNYYERSISRGSSPKLKGSNIETMPVLENNTASCCNQGSELGQYVNTGVETEDTSNSSEIGDRRLGDTCNDENTNGSLNQSEQNISQCTDNGTGLQECGPNDILQEQVGDEDNDRQSQVNGEEPAVSSTSQASPPDNDEDEKQYKLNILDRRRNTKFIKMVHDTRNRENIVQ